MAIYHFHPETGSNGNSGADWANAKQYIDGLSLSPGDELRFAKSPAPRSLGNGVWTTGSYAIQLDTGLVQHLLDGNETWVASSDVSLTTNANTRGNADNGQSQRIDIAAGFTTGMAAYHEFASALDLSFFEQVCFHFQSSGTFSAGDFQLVLCSDTAGATPVHSIDLPAITDTNDWTSVIFDNAGTLSGSIQSIALYVVNDVGARNISIDNVWVAKASGDAEEITPSTVIGLNGTGFNAIWYTVVGVKSDDQTLVISPQSNLNLDAVQNTGWGGTTGTYNTYARQCHILPSLAISSTSWNNITTANLTGNKDNPVLVKGGYNTSTDTQDGITWIFVNGPQGRGTIMQIGANVVGVHVEKFGQSGGYDPVYVNDAVAISFEDIYLSGAAHYGLYFLRTSGAGLRTYTLTGVYPPCRYQEWTEATPTGGWWTPATLTGARPTH